MKDFLVQFSVYYEKLRIRFVKIVELCKHHENIGAGMNCFFSFGRGKGVVKRLFKNINHKFV